MVAKIKIRLLAIGLLFPGFLAFSPSPNVSLQPLQDGVVAVAWSPDGTMIAGAGTNGLLRIWDTNGTSILHFPDMNGTVLAVTWSPDSQKLASTGSDLLIRVWNIGDPQYAQGELIATFTGHQSAPFALAWSPDGTRLASGSYGDIPGLKVWDVLTFQPDPIAEQVTSNIHRVAWSPDSNYIGTASASGIMVFDADLNYPQYMPAEYRFGRNIEAIAIAWSPDGQRLVGGYGNSTLIIWDAITKQQLAILQGHTALVQTVAWSPDGNYIASASNDNTIRIWDMQTGMTTSILQNDKPVGTVTISWSPDGTKLAYGGAGTNLEIADILANTLGNRIWLDANGNGIQDAGEIGMPGLTVNLLNNNFGIVQTVQTNAYGFYTFADLVPGTNYYIQIIPPADTYTIAPVDRGTDDTRDSDFEWRDNFGTPDPNDRVLRSMRFTASAGMQRDDVDAGLMQP